MKNNSSLLFPLAIVTAIVVLIAITLGATFTGFTRTMALELAQWQTFTGDWKNLFTYLERLDKVTPQDIQRVAKATFTPGNRTVAWIEPIEQASAAK